MVETTVPQETWQISLPTLELHTLLSTFGPPALPLAAGGQATHG